MKLNLDLEEIFCIVCDFVDFLDKKVFKKKNIGRKGKLLREEYLTLAILKQKLEFRTTKRLYNFVKKHLSKAFNTLPSYTQFVIGMQSNLKYLTSIVHIISK